MKKKIEQLLSGKFEYEQPELLFSKDKIEITMQAGETAQGKLYLGTDDNRKIRGYVTSSNRRIVPGADRFSGTTVCLPYGVDTTGMKPGESFEGWLCFTTDVGEHRVPVRVSTEKHEIRSASGEITNMEAFQEIARNNFREAYRLFTDRGFSGILKNAGEKERSLYAGLSRQPVTYQHVEEFLVAMGCKERVEISLESPGKELFGVRESRKEGFTIQRSGWGHLRLEIEVRGDFLETERRVITDEDFIGSFYHLDYIIRKERVGKGLRYGSIVVRSPYQELEYSVSVTREREAGVDRNAGEKAARLGIAKTWLDYRCGQMGRDDCFVKVEQWLEGLFADGFDYPEYHLWQAYLCHLKGDDEEAKKILLTYQDKSYSKKDLEFAGTYLYLCIETGIYKGLGDGLRKIQNFYMQKGDSFPLFWILLQKDPELSISPAKAVFQMEELFEHGCRSPFLYLEAWNAIRSDLSLLHRLSPFWIQVFLFAGKKGLLTEELSMRLAYLSGYEKQFSESLYRSLAYACEAYPSEDGLEAICKYIMKGNPRRPEYFPWFSKAVEQGLRLTRLYEYYVETMDTSYHRELPKPLLMYFTYNTNTLGDAKKAFLFACVIANKEKDPERYESYRDMMKAFAVAKLAEGRMNEDYAALYQEFAGEPENKKEAEELAGKLFTCRLYCDDRKLRYVIVRHSQMCKEEIYPFVHGVAYPRIYTEDAAILFQDEKQRRYAATVDYNVKKLMDERESVSSILSKGISEPGLLLHYCETAKLSRENMEIFQRLVQSDAFTEEYKGAVRRKILSYYAEHVHGEDLDGYLKKLDYREYARVDRTTLLEVLISRGLFSQAIGIIEEFGFEGLDIRSLLKVTSRTLVRCEMAEDEELLALASHVYRSGIYDEVILQYLMQYRFGPVDELLEIRKSAEGFEMDTYELDERILGLLMFTGDYRKEGEAVLESYVKQSGKERIIGAYLTQVAYGTFVKEYPMSDFVRQGLEHAYEKKWPVNRICRMALLKSLSRDKNPDETHREMERALLAECAEAGMVFSFYRRLPPEFLSPYQLDDKLYVEYHASPEAKVTLFYALDTGLDLEPEYKSEPLRNLYEGIFTKTFTLFYGESLHYYFQIEEKGKTRKTSERVLTMNRIEGNPMSKYQLINQILAARRLDKEQDVQKQMKQYLRQDQYVKEMFAIEKEA